MSFLYKPMREFMTPNNIPINPAIKNNFTLVINGLTCLAYRFSIYDLDNNRIIPPSTNRVDLDSPLFNGDTLNINVPSGVLIAGNDYKWQVDLHGNDLIVSDIDITTNILTVQNHNLNTGDIIFIQSTGTLPTGTSAFTPYYIRKLSSNTLALYLTYEASAQSNGAKVDITSIGTGTTSISNVVTSQQVLFSCYNQSTLTLIGKVIKSQSYEFVPIYNQSEGNIINEFTANLFDSDENLVDTSGKVFSPNVKYTFTGLLNGDYKVQFVATNLVGQTMDTGLVSYTVSYNEPIANINLNVTNMYNNGSVKFEWSDVVQINGNVSGSYSFIENFINSGQQGIKLEAKTLLQYNELNISNINTDIFLWSPVSASFTGDILKLENSTTNDFLSVGYNGHSFYRNVNNIMFYNPPMSLIDNGIYLIVLTPTKLSIIIYDTQAI